jgi:hypothetical protein
MPLCVPSAALAEETGSEDWVAIGSEHDGWKIGAGIRYLFH